MAKTVEIPITVKVVVEDPSHKLTEYEIIDEMNRQTEGLGHTCECGKHADDVVVIQKEEYEALDQAISTLVDNIRALEGTLMMKINGYYEVGEAELSSVREAMLELNELQVELHLKE